jgi:hypothetical protein
VADTTLDKDLWMAENQSTGKGGGIWHAGNVVRKIMIFSLVMFSI